jgi:hypothetical protein
MEIWKDFNQYYEVSSIGNVRSKDREIRSTFGGSYLKEGRFLKQNDNGQGYLQVMLCSNGVNKNERVHRMVALAFIPNPDGLPKVNHKDCNKRNNSYNNLEWCTQAYNVEHAIANSRQSIGESRSNHKLDEIAVRAIKLLIREGATNKTIAQEFNVHSGTIHCIRIGRNWAHVILDTAA